MCPNPFYMFSYFSGSWRSSKIICVPWSCWRARRVPWELESLRQMRCFFWGNFVTPKSPGGRYHHGPHMFSQCFVELAELPPKDLTKKMVGFFLKIPHQTFTNHHRNFHEFSKVPIECSVSFAAGLTVPMATTMASSLPKLSESTRVKRLSR